MVIKHTIGKHFYEVFPELINCDYYKMVRFFETYYQFSTEKPKIKESGNALIIELNIQSIDNELQLIKRLNDRVEIEKSTEVLIAS